MQMTLTDLLADAALADNHEDDLHRDILRVLKQTPPEAMTLRDRFRAVAWLQRAVLTLAQENDYFRVAGDEEEVIDERKLPKEMAALLAINATLQCSPAVSRWLGEGRRQLLAQLDYAGMNAQWHAIGKQDRLLLLTNFAKTVLDAQKSALETGSRLMLDETTRQIYSNCRIVWIEKGTDYYIGINRSLLEKNTAADALCVTYHESLHVAFNELAMKFGAGMIDEADPLYADAQLIWTKKMHGDPAASAQILSFYEQETEEKPVYETQKKFSRILMRREAS